MQANHSVTPRTWAIDGEQLACIANSETPEASKEATRLAEALVAFWLWLFGTSLSSVNSFSTSWSLYLVLKWTLNSLIESNIVINCCLSWNNHLIWFKKKNCLICIFLFFFNSRRLFIAAIKPNRPNCASQTVELWFTLHWSSNFLSFFSFFSASLYLTWIHVCSSIFALNHILQIGRQLWISLSGDPGKIQFYDTPPHPPTPFCGCGLVQTPLW